MGTDLIDTREKEKVSEEATKDPEILLEQMEAANILLHKQDAERKLSMGRQNSRG